MPFQHRVRRYSLRVSIGFSEEQVSGKRGIVRHIDAIRKYAPFLHKHALIHIFVIVVAVYAMVAGERLDQPSPHFHFVDLAHSFMDGRLDTDTPRQRRGAKANDQDPPGYRDAIERALEGGGWNDWSFIEKLTLKDGTVHEGRYPWRDGPKRHTFWTNKHEEVPDLRNMDLARTCGEQGNRLCKERTYYISFPPAPGVVMMPFAAIWNYDTNDVWITILFAGLNAMLLFIFLRLLVQRGHSQRSDGENLWLVALFAFGSVVFFSSVRGEVWFTALVFGVTFNLLYMLAALDLKHPILAGLMLGIGMATRTPIAFCVVFFAWQLFFPGNKWQSDRWKEIFTKGALFAIPVLAVGIALMAYNEARFGSAFEFGHSYLTGGAGARVRDHGMFSSHWLNRNLSAALTNMPVVDSVAPYLKISKHGLGLLVTMPALFLLARPARHAPIVRALWLTVIIAAIPALFYQNTGWEQFSYRLAMDYLPYLMALLAIGGRALTWKVKLVFVFCIAINLFGAITFTHFGSTFYN